MSWALPSENSPSGRAVEWAKGRFGCRCAMALWITLIPTLLALVFPVIPLYLGHLEPPGILLSNFMAERATYQSFFIVCFGIPMVVGTFLLAEVGRHLSDHGVRRSAINAFLTLVVVACGTGLLTLLAFNFEDKSDKDSLESRLHTWIHITGTMVYFAGAGFGGLIYTKYLLPEAELKSALHPMDASWLHSLGRQLVLGTMTAALIRCGHLTWPVTCAYLMLVAECYLIGLGVCIVVLGHWRTYMYLDGTDPLLDFSFLTEPVAKPCGKSE
mmetsp:Transcript_99370/g.206998  ORF Transcript_99370/g.206998 Transcript_99370/m.206998 type:complete len:271 (+) Transcript_99370:312-1124(+)|eukprot:CAMPEP_0206448526 /NCGR_PEP_ID=MMETSP0324_2-20121206/17524_1 /ASSEMBLY_ACC=CAM_ASM_000836 /TAXON_ID=2866 /ORGANISM="Crypthecodinium cohnii, Strain Seligo" /LENGTH=270 /DNA_ID=CAMNT_0053917685 /DNA_START=281 /DNA_END=1093 /DNA_ORIENTATION=+